MARSKQTARPPVRTPHLALAVPFAGAATAPRLPKKVPVIRPTAPVAAGPPTAPTVASRLAKSSRAPLVHSLGHTLRTTKTFRRSRRERYIGYKAMRTISLKSQKCVRVSEGVYEHVEAMIIEVVREITPRMLKYMYMAGRQTLLPMDVLKGITDSTYRTLLRCDLGGLGEALE